MASKRKQKNDASRTATAANGANLGFERRLWAAADKMRGSMDPSEYKHIALGLIFLKYISDAFEAHRAALLENKQADAEDPDEYLAANVFWVPDKARWSHFQAHARQPSIGKIIDDAMHAIESRNKILKGVLPKIYARPMLNKVMLGELIDLVSGIGMGEKSDRSRDVLGRVYEYFLGAFASAEGKGGGEFYTPSSIVRLLVEMLEPYKGRVYDPCCGSGGMFVQSGRFVEEHGGRIVDDIAIYGQESNPTTWRLARMNLAVRGIPAELHWNNEGSFHKDALPDLKADFILANPPFNDKDWGGERLREDARWRFGVPVSNSNYAWLQHIRHHLAPGGAAGVVLANVTMSSGKSDEAAIRRALVAADQVDCMVELPGQLFYTTSSLACLWLLSRDKNADKKGGRDRRGQVLFIDARALGRMVDRKHREFTDEDIEKVARCYHAWRGEPDAGEYQDIPGFCKAATLEEIEERDCVLAPGRYVGAAPVEEDGEPFADKMRRLAADLGEQQAEGARLDAEIRRNLQKLGFDAGKS